MLSVDGVVVNGNISSMSAALKMWFSAYYIFGIVYPSDIAASLEFIHRYILDKFCSLLHLPTVQTYK